MTTPPPPRLATRLLRRCLPDGRADEAVWDLQELYEIRAARQGLAAARRAYVRDVLSIVARRSLRRERPAFGRLSDPQPGALLMWTNYLKIALRSLRRHPGMTFINVFGLAVGIACCVLVLGFVRDELRFDRFHADADRVYRVWVDENYGENERFVNTTTPLPLAPALEAQFPEVEDAVRVARLSAMVREGETVYAESVHLVDSTFLDIFDFDLVLGDAGTVLDAPYGIVLTERLAHKYFGERDPVGQTLAVRLGDDFEDFTVTGVAVDPPTYSSIQFDALVSFHHGGDVFSPRAQASWFNVFPETYVLLRPDASAEALAPKLDAIARLALGDEYRPGVYNVGLQPLTAIHLDTSLPPGLEPTSDPAYVYVLSAIALLVLVVASINFTALAVGRSASRAREVGVRKVVGARRPQLMGQFWGEALLLTGFALVAGLFLAQATLPLFNDLAGRTLTLSLDGFTVVFLLGLTLVVALLAGSYPAAVLSSFRPTDVLKGRLPLGGRHGFRRGLTVAQFALSIFLIIATLGMRDQLRYLQEKPLGFDREQVVLLPTNAGGEEGEALAERFRGLAGDEPRVAATAYAAFAPGAGWAKVGYTDEAGAYREFRMNFTSPEFAETMGLELVAGRGFDRSRPADLRTGLVVNEALVRAYGWEEPLGRRLPGADFGQHEVIGVVKDFHYASLHAPIEPLVLVVEPDSLFKGIENVGFPSSPARDLVVRVTAGDLVGTMQVLERLWAQAAPGQSFEYTFLDEALDRQYRQEQQLGRIATVAAVLSILIACLGLLGLAALTAVRRTKEIGIRKVLGASVAQVSLLLTREFAVLVGVAFVVAAPAAYFALQAWLRDFAYRTSPDVWLFLLGGLLAFVVAVVTVGAQALRAARTDPASVLRYE